MAGFSSKPSNYPFLQKLRKATKASLKPCSYIKPTTKLRDYQVIGVLHFLSLARMILGDGVGLGKCVSLRTYISTTYGLKRLQELIPDNPKDDTLYPFSDDCKLLTINGPVKPDAVYYCGVRDGIKIRTQKGYELIGLPHHPVYTPTDIFFDYRRLDSLNVGDYICINRRGLFAKDYVKISYTKKSCNSKTYRIPEYLNEELAELLGFYVSNGHSSWVQSFVISQQDPAIHTRIRDLLYDIFGYEQKENKINYSEEIKVHSVEILNIFKYLGVDISAKSGEQIVPNAILCSPESVVAAFLRGYFEGDGSAEKSNNIVSCSSKSDTLINQLQLLLLNLGVTSRRKVKMVKVGEVRRPYYVLYFCGKDVVVFKQKIGFISDRKNDITQGICAKKRNSNLDIIPIGKPLLKQAIKDITTYLKSLPQHKGFSVKGSGWKGLVGYHLKRMIEEVIYYKKNLTYELFNSFMQEIDKHNLKDVVLNYTTLKFIQDQNFYFDKIVSIEQVKDTFADFHVPGEHNFVGNGFVNHNTLQMITSYAYRLMSEPNLKLLVVTAKSAMAQWSEEFDKFCEGITVHVLSNTYGQVRRKDASGKLQDVEEYGFVEDLKARGEKCRTLKGFEARKAQYKSVKAHVLITNYYAVKEDYVFLSENRGPDFQVGFDECFCYHTPIMLADGTTELIGKIVTNKMNVSVLSYNFETGVVEPRKVVNFFRNETQNWYKVKRKRTSSVICSPNHGFYTPSGKKRADELLPGDIIYGITKKITEVQKQVILGSLLGDGWDICEDVVEYSTPFKYSNKTFSKYRYNIEVEGNHNYFANNILVSNCQEFKNIKTKTWFGANEISEKAKYCYGMSATIIKNRLEEAYYIYRVIVPGLFPGKVKFFAEYTVRKKMTMWRKGRKQRFNKIVGYTNLQQFKETIDPFFLIRRTRDVASELPQLISRKLILEMSEAQAHLYQKALSGELYKDLIKDKYFKYENYINSKVEDPTDKENETFEILKMKYEESLTKEGMQKNKIAALSYCQLVSNGPGWLNEDGESSKETEFRRLFDQELSGEKTIVFTRFKSGIKRLSAILNDLGLKHVKITGDDSIDERTNARKSFQDLSNDCNVIFITQAGSAAINLQAAGVILYYDTPWSYGDLYQSIGRAQRIGSIQEHILLLHMVNKKTIDEHVLNILESKKDLINQIVGDIAQGAIDFKNDEVLFKEDESSVSALFDTVFS